jgi:hypothetical protein
MGRSPGDGSQVTDPGKKLSWSEIERRRADYELQKGAIARMVETLCNNARSMEKIGGRLLILNFALGNFGVEISQRELADRIGISEKSLSERLCAMREDLEEVLKLGVSETGEE